jgi:hypothetical protein
MIKLSVSAGIVVLMAASAANASNVPSWSPYAIMTPDFPSAPIAAADSSAGSYRPESGMRENRAAYVDAGVTPNANVPSWSAYSIMPQGR